MPYSSYLKNKWLDVLRSNSVGVTFTAPTNVYASLHSGAPGDTGANEVTGGTPAYARKAVTSAAAASGGAISYTADVVFDVPAVTVAHVGYWDAITAGNFLGSDPVTNEVFGAQGTYTLTQTDLDLNA